jgi:hypothetical protein
MKRLTKRTAQNQYLFVGELLAGGRDFKPKMVCLKKFVDIIFFFTVYKLFKYFLFFLCALCYNLLFLLFYVVRAMHFGMKLYSPSSEAGVPLQSGSSLLGMVSAPRC